MQGHKKGKEGERDCMLTSSSCHPLPMTASAGSIDVPPAHRSPMIGIIHTHVLVAREVFGQLLANGRNVEVEAQHVHRDKDADKAADT